MRAVCVSECAFFVSLLGIQDELRLFAADKWSECRKRKGNGLELRLKRRHAVLLQMNRKWSSAVEHRIKRDKKCNCLSVSSLELLIKCLYTTMAQPITMWPATLSLPLFLIRLHGTFCATRISSRGANGATHTTEKRIMCATKQVKSKCRRSHLPFIKQQINLLDFLNVP